MALPEDARPRSTPPRRWVRQIAAVVMLVLAVLAIVLFLKVRGVGLSSTPTALVISDGVPAPGGPQLDVLDVKAPVNSWFVVAIQVQSHGSLAMDVRDIVPEDGRGVAQSLLPLSDIRTASQVPNSISQQTWRRASPWDGRWPQGSTEFLVLRVPVRRCAEQIAGLRFDAAVFGFGEQYMVSLNGLEIHVQPVGGSCTSG
jgi:hypothetical protein